MCKRTLGTLLVLTLAVVMVVGCATTGGNKEQKAIDKTLANWKAAVEKQDVDGMMTAYSESFKGERDANKAAMKDFLANAKTEGYLDGAKADMSKAQVKIEKDTASVGPIELSSNAGAFTVQVTLKKDPDNVWRIVASDRAQ